MQRPDPGKGIHKAIVETYGRLAVIQRCQVHKKRNILDHLPAERHADGQPDDQSGLSEVATQALLNVVRRIDGC